MHDKPLAGYKVAILAASGFDEKDMTEAQRALSSSGATVRLISVDHGLVNSWDGRGWGHHFPVDCGLSSALAADYDMLFVPAGSRSLSKLRLTAHTKRFLGGFMLACKPVAIFGDALALLAENDMLSGRKVAASGATAQAAETAGATLTDESIAVDRNLLTCEKLEAEHQDCVDAMLRHFLAWVEMARAA